MTNRSKARGGRIIATLLLAVAWSPISPPPQASAQTEEQGEKLFSDRCTACHSIGGGRLVGPDLKGVVERRESSWLRRIIQEPDKLLADGDELATQLLREFNNVPMPNVGLSEDEVDALIAYLETAASAGQAQQSPPGGSAAEQGPPGDAKSGLRLFTGATRLANGGAACAACHSVAGVGALGGGSLGPDLTGVYQRLGKAGLAAALKGLPFPSMREIYEYRPLTAQELADLLAFFAQAQGEQARSGNSRFFLLGLGGFALLMALPPIFWRNRIRPVRQDLLGGQS